LEAGPNVGVHVGEGAVVETVHLWTEPTLLHCLLLQS
jgi:hypothetical protein